jgi:hypothetical protein
MGSLTAAIDAGLDLGGLDDGVDREHDGPPVKVGVTAIRW